MTKAELNAHWTLPDETLEDGYAISHKREREAFIKGWHKAFETYCEWLKDNMYNDEVWGVVVSNKYHSVEEFIDDFRKSDEE